MSVEGGRQGDEGRSGANLDLEDVIGSGLLQWVAVDPSCPAGDRISWDLGGLLAQGWVIVGKSPRYPCLLLYLPDEPRQVDRESVEGGSL